MLAVERILTIRYLPSIRDWPHSSETLGDAAAKDVPHWRRSAHFIVAFLSLVDPAGMLRLCAPSLASAPHRHFCHDIISVGKRQEGQLFRKRAGERGDMEGSKRSYLDNSYHVVIARASNRRGWQVSSPIHPFIHPIMWYRSSRPKKKKKK